VDIHEFAKRKWIILNYGDYFKIYAERNLLNFISVKNINSFRLFVKFCAERIGQLVNFNALSNDVGVSHTTMKEWFSILENSFSAYTVSPFYQNIGKRLVKSPKQYFYDTEFASYLIGIEKEKQLTTHSLKGNIFKNIVLNDILKMRYNQGRRNNLLFYRDSSGGGEVDCLYQVAEKYIVIGIKSAAAISTNFNRINFKIIISKILEIE
jgi:predicted AAA+ superfamily ATPase